MQQLGLFTEQDERKSVLSWFHFPRRLMPYVDGITGSIAAHDVESLAIYATGIVFRTTAAAPY